MVITRTQAAVVPEDEVTISMSKISTFMNMSMAICDCEAILHQQFIPQCQTVGKQFYTGVYDI
jgi:hypothetical protein